CGPGSPSSARWTMRWNARTENRVSSPTDPGASLIRKPSALSDRCRLPMSTDPARPSPPEPPVLPLSASTRRILPRDGATSPDGDRLRVRRPVRCCIVVQTMARGDEEMVMRKLALVALLAGCLLAACSGVGGPKIVCGDGKVEGT